MPRLDQSLYPSVLTLATPAQIVNTGRNIAYPTWTLVGRGRSPRLQLTDPQGNEQAYIQVLGDLAPGYVVTVVTQFGLVVSDAQGNVLLTQLGSTPWGLQPGTSYVNFFMSMTDDQASVTLTWTPD